MNRQQRRRIERSSDSIESTRKPLFIRGEAVGSVATHETFKWRQGSSTLRDGKMVQIIESKTSRHRLDISWLKAAADAYNISSDPRDYVISEVPLVTVGIPNRNMDAFPFDEVSRFSHILGCMVYESFRHKPTFLNHDNKDPSKAKGVNFDASLRKVGKNLYKIFVLSGFDRTKDAYLAENIQQGKRDKFSMGAYVDHTKCSVHNRQNGPPPTRCCNYKKGAIVNGILRFDNCYGVNYIENSSVDDPADPFAWSPEVWG